MWLIANLPLLTSRLHGQSHLLLRPGPVAQTLVRPEPELGTLQGQPDQDAANLAASSEPLVKAEILRFVFFELGMWSFDLKFDSTYK